MAATLWDAGTVNAFSTTLNGSITNSDATITLTTTTGLSNTGVLVIDRQNALGNNTPTTREYISYTGITTNTLTGVTRGLGGSAAQAHSSGAIIEEIMTITHWNDLLDWLGTNTITPNDTQSLNNKTLGTGSVISLGSDAQGDVYYRNGSGVLARLAPGTDGQFLKTRGAAQNPEWATVTAGDSRMSVTLNAFNVSLPDSNFAAISKTAGTNWMYHTLDFDASTDESAYWNLFIPSDLTPASAKLILYWTATGGSATQACYWDVTTRYPTDDEVIDATTTPSTATDSGNDALIATGDIHRFEITLTTTNWAAGDMLQVKLTRDANHGSDNLAADAKVIMAVLEIR